MDLKELQSAWSEMSDQLEHQKKLTHQIIMDMTQQKYRNRFRTFWQYEGLGAVICYGMAIYLIGHFGKLDTWYFKILGGLALAFLLGLPAWILYSLSKIHSINLLESTYKEALLDFTKARRNLLLAQQASIYLSFLFIFVSLPLAGKLMKNRDFFREDLDWLWFVPILGLFVYVFSRWAYKHYLKATRKAEALIRELE